MMKKEEYVEHVCYEHRFKCLPYMWVETPDNQLLYVINNRKCQLMELL